MIDDELHEELHVHKQPQAPADAEQPGIVSFPPPPKAPPADFAGINQAVGHPIGVPMEQARTFNDPDVLDRLNRAARSGAWMVAVAWRDEAGNISCCCKQHGLNTEKRCEVEVARDLIAENTANVVTKAQEKCRKDKESTTELEQ